MVQELRPEHRSKLIIGLTGTFGAGKSTVANFFRELGASVSDADKLAHAALENGSEVYDRLAALFPEAAGKDGAIDRKKLAAVVFQDEKRRKKLEDVVHPFVLSIMSEEISDAADPIVVLDVPLLFESGFDRICDKTVAVTARPEVIENRLSGKGFSKAEIEARNKAQFSAEEKNQKADFVIDNSENLTQTKREVEKIMKQLHALLKGEH